MSLGSNPVKVSMNQRLLMAFLLSLMATSVSVAQTQTGTLLPEIDPQDIEIRGDFRIRFASLIRQPILGFTNNHRLYALDPNRLPFMETEEQIRASMPIDDLERPVAPTRRRIVYPQKSSLYGKAGFGRFNSPEASLAIEAPLSETSSVLGGFTYDGGGDHLDVNSSYRLMNAQAGISSKIGTRGNLRVMGTVLNDINDTNNPDIQKDYLGAGLNAQYRNVTNSLTHTELVVGYNYYQVGSNIATSSSANDFEHRFSSRLTRQWAGSRINDIFLVHGRADVGQTQYNDDTSHLWALVGVMPTYQTRQKYNSRISVGGRAYFGTDGSGSKPAVYPDAKIEFFGIDNIIVSGHLYGEMTNKGLDGIHTGNRFSGLNSRVENERKWVADTRLDLQVLNAISVYGGLQYRYSPKYGYYQKSPLLVPGSSYDIFYDDKMTQLQIKAGAQITIIPSLVTLHGWVYNQTHSLKDGSKIPYIENTGLIAETQFTPFRRLALRSWVHYVGDRQTGIENESLGSYLLVNAQAEFMLSNQVGFYFKGLNLLGQEYQLWSGYNERPLQLYGGVVIRL
jgi:hypothetical protein